MTTKGFFISRIEIKNEIQRNLAARNSWQARYVKAANNGNTEQATITKARAVRSEHRTQSIMDFLSIACDVEMECEYEYSDIIEGFHPVTSVYIKWNPDELEKVEIEH